MMLMIIERFTDEGVGNFLRKPRKYAALLLTAMALSACSNDAEMPIPSMPTSPSRNPGVVKDLIWVSTDIKADEIVWGRSGRAEALPTPDDPSPDEAVLMVARKSDFENCKQKGVFFIDGGGAVQKGMLTAGDDLPTHPDAPDVSYAARMRLGPKELFATFVCDSDGPGGQQPTPVRSDIVAIFDIGNSYGDVPLY